MGSRVILQCSMKQEFTDTSHVALSKYSTGSLLLTGTHSFLDEVVGGRIQKPCGRTSHFPFTSTKGF